MGAELGSPRRNEAAAGAEPNGCVAGLTLRRGDEIAESSLI